MKPNISTLNISLIVLGTLIMAAGLYRTIPLRLDKAFWLQNGPLLCFLIVGIYFFRRAIQAELAIRLSSTIKADSVTQWATSTIGLCGRFLPLMMLLTLVMGIGGVLCRMYNPEIRQFLLDHHVLGPLVGSFVAPTPNTVVPIVEGLWENKKLQPMFLYFLQAASLISLPLFMLRQLGFKNQEICTKMYITGCIIALGVFPLMRWIYALTEFIYAHI